MVDAVGFPALLTLFSLISKHKNMSVEVKIRKGEPIERALRRLKKRLDREGVIRDVRAKRYYEKPCDVRRRKKKVAAFSAMLRARYENQ
jgi:small subunit ribosomal protein S21